MKKSITECIVGVLADGEFMFGGLLARRVHEMTGSKEGNIERICRGMAEEERELKDGTIEKLDPALERAYQQIGGKGRAYVMYRIKHV